MTGLGGAMGAGTVFELAPPSTEGNAWTETLLYSFAGGVRGDYPVSSPVLAPDGSIYGTTHGTWDPGGYPGRIGLGVVFQLTPPAAPAGAWLETVLAGFDDPNGMYGPTSPPVVAGGRIYFTVSTPQGGDVLELDRPAAGGLWSKTVLHSFTDGQMPGGTLLADESGAIYGVTTNWSSPTYSGTVYRIKP
jgi:hypothetical protein